MIALIKEGTIQQKDRDRLITKLNFFSTTDYDNFVKSKDRKE